MTDFAFAQWRRAKQSLASAKLLAETDPNSAASRAYYAAFHAVTALFALREQSFTKHTAVRAAVHRDLVRNGAWPPDLGNAFDALMDARETGDYGGTQGVSQDGAVLAAERAAEILEAVRRTCPQLTQQPGQP